MNEADIQRVGLGERFAGGVRYGGLIWLAGHVSGDRALGVRGQTAAILSRIDARLAELGSDKTRLVMANIWLADIATFDEMNAAWDAWVDRATCPRATVEAEARGARVPGSRSRSSPRQAKRGSTTMEPPPVGTAVPPEVLPGTLHLFGFPDVPARVTIERHDKGARMRRALKALGACWGLAVVSVIVPIAHFVLVPGFLVLGIVLAGQRGREAASVRTVEGHCPRCNAERTFIASGALRAEMKAQCPVCRNELALAFPGETTGARG